MKEPLRLGYEQKRLKKGDITYTLKIIKFKKQKWSINHRKTLKVIYFPVEIVLYFQIN